jgi:hypothetical protein
MTSLGCCWVEEVLFSVVGGLLLVFMSVVTVEEVGYFVDPFMEGIALLDISSSTPD